MAAPASPSAKDAAVGSASAPALKEMSFPLPPTTLHDVQAKVEATASPSTSAPSERVIVPQRGTLAAGRIEARPMTIWIVVAVGTLLLLGWALYRVRRASAERRKKLEALTTVRKSTA
ncbi:MAG: hypothetical protein HYV09_23705 [Deltaproteobacteria bacterium]|nr:hypothetical protein [Deltaproteobacteria bacterium]